MRPGGASGAPATNGAVIRVPDAKGATADMKSKYREAATKGEHVAQYLPSEEDTLDLLKHILPS